MMKQNNYCNRGFSISSGWVVAMALLLSAPLSLLAQNTGSITGRVSDANTGTYLGGVYVTAAGLNTSTNRSGEYVLRGVPSGSQQVNFSYLGYDSVSQSVNVTAGQRASLNAVLGTEVIELAEFVVQSQMQGQAKAINAQRVADNIQNIVSSDAIGFYPDRNTADALSRLPGLSIRQDQGEGRNIIIRGIDPNLVAVTINGVSLPTPDDERRAVTLDTIPSDILGSMTVTKTFTPDMDGDAIGGSVELTSASAFDREERMVGIRLEYGYSNLGDYWSPRYGFTYSDIYSVGNGENNLGFFFGITHHDRDFGSHGLEGDEYDIEEDPDSGNEFLFPDEIEYRQYSINRKRSGLALNLDYKPSATSKLFARFQLNLFDDTEIKDRTELKLGKAKSVESLSANSGTFKKIDIDKSLGDRTQEQTILALVVGGEHEVGRWKFDYQGSYSFAGEIEDDTNESKWDEEIDFDVSYVLSDGGLPSSIVITGTESGSEDDFFDANNYKIEGDSIEGNDNEFEDEQFAFKFDATYDTELFGHPGSLKFGVKARFREKTVNDTSIIYEWEGDDLLIGGGPGSDVGSFEGPKAIYRIRPYGPTIDSQKLRTFWVNNIRTDGTGFNKNTDDALADSVRKSIGDDYTINEDVYAGYVMGRVDIDKLRILAGVRVEATKADQKGFTFKRDDIEEDVAGGGDGSAAIFPVSFNKSYTDVLPSINLRYAQNENLIYRASITKSIVRPTFGGQAPRTSINDDETSVSTGNPELDPFESWNFDAVVEYYMPRLGILSAGVFYKSIDNSIATVITSETSFPGANPEDPDEDVVVRRPVNGDTADVFGIEFNWQQRLDFLPTPLDGMLIGLNYAIIDSEATFNMPGRAENEKLPFPKQSDNVGNFSIGYEKYGLSVRLAARFASSYLDAFFHIDGEPLDRFQDDHIQWDLTASYRVNDRLKIYFEMINIADEPNFYYFGQPKFVSQHESYDWSTTFGLTYNL